MNLKDLENLLLWRLVGPRRDTLFIIIVDVLVVNVGVFLRAPLDSVL